MADFLERISRMALGATPAIQPLVASRYAPGAYVAVPEMSERKVTLESPAEDPSTSVAEHPQTMRTEGDDPSAPQAVAPDAAPTDPRRPPAPREDSTEPAIIEQVGPDIASRFVEPVA